MAVKVIHKMHTDENFQACLFWKSDVSVTGGISGSSSLKRYYVFFVWSGLEYCREKNHIFHFFVVFHETVHKGLPPSRV